MPRDVTAPGATLSHETLAPIAHAIVAEHEASLTPVVVSAGVHHGGGTSAAPRPADLHVPVGEVSPLIAELSRYEKANPIDPLKEPGHDGSGALPPPPPPPPIVASWSPIVFTDGTPVGGWATVTLYADGNVTFTGNLHDSGLPDFSDQIVFVFEASNGAAFSLQHTGDLHGTLSSGSRDDNWNENTNNAALADAFQALSAGYSWSGSVSVNWDVNALLDEVKAAVGAAEGVIALL